MADSLLKRGLRRLRRNGEEEIDWIARAEEGLVDADPRDREIIRGALPYTMTGVPRLQALVDAVRYVTAREIPGGFVECGVWKGGSVLAMIRTLQSLGVDDRDIYLYDTFTGMTEPTEADTSQYYRPATELWEESDGRPFPEFFDPSIFSEEGVRSTVLSSGYPEERIHLVRGPVEETLPEESPGEIALLRLDTDWYESTRHELLHLYPLLGEGGVLILDDYGHWDGARKAVDEFFASEATPLLMNRIDYAGRIAIKA
jgi:O-methyltransferase